MTRRADGRPPSRGLRPMVGPLLLLLLSLVASTLVTPPLPAAAADSTDGCPSAEVPATAFRDTVRSTHRAAIDCLAWWSLTEGRTPTVYGVGDPITRGQTAAMLARLLERTGTAPEQVAEAGFTDTAGHPFAAAIDLLADLGIVEGRTATTFEPNGDTTRAQMATVVVRTLERAYGMTLAQGGVPFGDVSAGSTHHAAIDKLVTAGITAGTTATTYQPGRAVTRAQMASFLTRSTSSLAAEGLATLPAPRPGENDPFKLAVRGTWVHLFDDTLKSRASIRAMVDELDAADVNTVYVQVARRHDAYYDSDVLPATLDPGLETGLDILEELLPLAHSRGIAVHAWFGVAPSWHQVYERLGVDPEQLGADVAWRTRTHAGEESDYLDPALPEVRRHVAAVVGELAANYPLDGIHLDYVRYASNRHGYHPDALARFRSERGVSGTPDPGDWQWSQWRREQTRELILTARATIRAENPNPALSTATISWPEGPATPDRPGFIATRSHREALQDWDGWARRGEIDAIVPMNYFRDHDGDQAAGRQQWLAYQRALSADTGTRVALGVAGYLNRPAAVVRQVHDAMQQGDGAVVYSFQQPTDDHSRGVWRNLARTRWGYPPTAP